MYRITFTDGTEFDGGDPHESNWDMIPDKPIKSIVYWISETTKFSFTDFEEYNHCVEWVQGVNISLKKISKVIIMGRTKDRVYQVIFDFQRPALYQLVTPYGKEYSSQERLGDRGEFLGYLNGKPISGWRNGILDAPYPGPKLKRIE